MTLYYGIIMIIFLLGLVSNDRKYKKIYVYLICLLLSLIAGLRHYTIGNDTETYLRAFNDVIMLEKNIIGYTRYEIGYTLLMLLFTKLSTNFNLFLFIISLFINLSIGNFIIKKSKNPTYSLILFILCRYFFSEMNIMRQMIAIAIILNSVVFIEEKKIAKYLLSVVVASLFHKSAILFVFLYFLYDYELKNIRKIRLFTIVMLIFIFLNPILTWITHILGYYSNYVSNYMDSNKIGNFISMLIVLLEYLFISNYKKKKKISLSKDEMFMYNILVSALIINFLSIRISVLDRCGSYLEIFSIVLIPNIIAKESSPKKRLLWYIMFFACFLIYFLTITYLRPNWNYINPYRFFWQ